MTHFESMVREQEFWTPREAAAILGVTPRWLRHLMAVGRIAGCRPTGPTGGWRIPSAELLRMTTPEGNRAHDRW